MGSMDSDKIKWISLMIVPEGGASMRKWRISQKQYLLLKIGIWVLGVLLLLGILSSFALGVMYLQVRHYKKVNTELMEASYKIETISKRLADYEAKEKQLRRVLGGDLNLPDTPPAEISALVESGQPEKEPNTGFTELDTAIEKEETKARHIPSIWPVQPWQISKDFIYSGSVKKDHLGIDILTGAKSPVVAVADGKVIFADIDEKLGLRVSIDHNNGWVTEYGHNAILLVKYGDIVKKGQTIAIYGATDSYGSGPHLHFAMFYNKKPKNPVDFLPKINIAKKM